MATIETNKKKEGMAGGGKKNLLDNGYCVWHRENLRKTSR